MAAAEIMPASTGTLLPRGEPSIHGSERQWRTTQAIGRSRGGLTTRIVALADALENLLDFLLLPGQAHDRKGVAPLIECEDFDALPADKAFDADWLRAEPDQRGAVAVIPPKANRKARRDHDKHAYEWRHLFENVFAKRKGFRAPATRYEKPTAGCAANWHLAATRVASR